MVPHSEQSKSSCFFKCLHDYVYQFELFCFPSLIPRPSPPPVFDHLQFLHTASDQKLDGGEDLEKRLLFSYISQSKTTFIKELFMICYWYILSPVNNDIFDVIVHAPMQTKVLEGKLNFFSTTILTTP